MAKSGRPLVAVFECWPDAEGEAREQQYQKLWELERTALTLCNTICHWWVTWHFLNNTPDKIRDRLALPKEDRPKDDPIPKWPASTHGELQFSIHRQNAERFSPAINGGMIGYLERKVRQKIEAMPGKNSLPGWMEVLLGQRPPMAFKSFPIPFKPANSKLEKKDDEFRLKYRFDGGHGAPWYSLVLRTQGKRCASERAKLEKMTEGIYDFCSVDLQYRKSRKKWFAIIAYRVPETSKPKLDKRKKAVLEAGEDFCWKVTAGKQSRWLGGKPLQRLVGSRRRQILLGRLGRAASYRNAGSANKGHGRKRAQQPFNRFEKKWKDLVKDCNQKMTTDLIEWCVSNQVGTLIYQQPAAGKDAKLLASCGIKPGEIGEKKMPLTWDWYQVASFLEYKAKEFGVKVKVEKEKAEPEEVVDAGS